MTTNSWASRKAEVVQLSRAADRAVEIEQQQRRALAGKSRQVMTSGSVIALLGLTAVVVIGRGKRNEEGDEKGGARQSLLLRAGTLGLALMRWRNTATHLWHMFIDTPSSPPVRANAVEEAQ